MHVGFIGIGNMGWPMAANLVSKGFEVAVFDAVPSRAAQFVEEHGCRAAGQLMELADSDVLVTMLPTGLIVRQVLLEGDGGGLGRALKRGSVVIDMSSSEPVGTQQLGSELAKNGIALIDAPVSGGVPRAKTGTLTLMIGKNDPAALERVKPVLLAMGDRLFETGPLGSGHAMKALNNFVSGTSFAASSEALLVGARFGLDPDKMIDILNVSTGRNFATEMLMKEHVIGKKFASGFKVGLLAKDVKIASGLGQAMNLDMPVLRLICDRWAAARDRLGEARDHTEAFIAWNNMLSLKSKAE